ALGSDLLALEDGHGKSHTMKHLPNLGLSLIALTGVGTLARPVAAWPRAGIAGPDTSYGITTLAGNGMAGDIPDGGGKATEVRVDLPFGVENGPDGALYITTVGSPRVLRLDRQIGQITSVAGIGRKGYSGDGGPATKAMLNEPYEVRFDSRGNMLILE